VVAPGLLDAGQWEHESAAFREAVEPSFSRVRGTGIDINDIGCLE